MSTPAVSPTPRRRLVGLAPSKPLALVVLAASVSVSGCAGVPRTTLEPVKERVAGTRLVDMLVATTRAPSKVPGEVFDGRRGGEVSFDNVVVSVPPDSVRKPGEVIYPPQNPGDPARQFVAHKIEPLGLKGAIAWYDRVAGPKKRVLIFVHGFNNTYEDAILRFAQISTDLPIEAAPVLFTWPSGGSVFDYLYDRDSANYSRDALETMIQQITDSPDVEEVTLLAHSMGGWLAMEAVRQLAIRNGGHVPKKLSNIILASPDIDVDVFVTQLEQPMAPARRALEIAHKGRAITVLNPAPAADLPADMLALCDYVTPNESEAEALTGIKVISLEDAQKAAMALVARGAGAAVLTLGEKGALFHNGSETVHVPAINAGGVVDTTGAGDAFNGGLAAALARGAAPEDAVRFAGATAAISVTRHGTAPSMPREEEIRALLARG